MKMQIILDKVGNLEVRTSSPNKVEIQLLDYMVCPGGENDDCRYDPMFPSRPFILTQVEPEKLRKGQWL